VWWLVVCVWAAMVDGASRVCGVVWWSLCVLWGVL
jgi:hypothetical protein